MKLKSLVIVDNNATVNEKSDFAHTAHHARRIFEAVITKNFTLWYFNYLFKVKIIYKLLV
jgi:hypothetical protein